MKTLTPIELALVFVCLTFLVVGFFASETAKDHAWRRMQVDVNQACSDQCQGGYNLAEVNGDVSCQCTCSCGQQGD